MIREKIRPADCEQSIQRNRKRPVRLFRFYFANAFSVRNPQSRNCEVHAARNPSSRETGQREAAVCRTNRDPKNRRSGKTSTAAHSAGGSRHERAYGTETAASGPHCPDTDTAQLYRKVGTSSDQRKQSGSNPTVRKKIQAQTEICA